MQVIHGSAIALDGQAMLIVGPAGSGKSTLALAMLAMGARLVSDDQTRLWSEAGQIVADAPDTIRGLIEARGVGLLNAEAAGPSRVVLVVDLGRAEEARLPPERRIEILGQSLPLVLGPMSPHLAASLRQYLLAGRRA